MNLKNLFKMQKVLDDRIIQKHSLEERQDELFFMRIDAFRVELHELENEVKHFKFWSNKKPVFEKTLEEYVDGLHFLLSFGISIDIQPEVIPGVKLDGIPEQFRECVKLAVCLYEDDYYVDLFQHYIGLGEMLGFSWDQIEQAYFDKNKVNHERQDNGY